MHGCMDVRFTIVIYQYARLYGRQIYAVCEEDVAGTLVRYWDAGD